MKNLHSLLVLLLFAGPCSSQELMKSHQKQLGEEFTKSSVIIYNNSSSNLTVLIGDTLAPDTVRIKNTDSWISPPYSFDPFIKIQTKNQIIKYQLRLGNYYMIFWNQKRKCWDLKLTEKPN